MRAIGEPDQQEGKQGAEGGVGHQRDAPKQSVGAPVLKTRRIGERQSRPQNNYGQEGREAAVPHAFHRQQERVGENCPKPPGTDGERLASESKADEIQRYSGGDAAKNIESDHREPGMKGVATENTKDPGEKQGKKRGHPGGGAGIGAKGGGESVAVGQRISDIADFE